MRLEPLYRATFTTPEAWSAELADPAGTEGQSFLIAEGRCEGRLPGRPPRRELAAAADLRAAARTPPGSLTGASGADLKGVIRDRLAHRAGRIVRLGPVVAAPAGDDQEVLVNPGRLGTGQAVKEGRDGRAELLRSVEGERRVVASLGLGPEPLGRTRARMPEGLCRDHREPAGPPDGVAERGLAVQALLVLGETGEVAAQIVRAFCCGVRL